MKILLDASARAISLLNASWNAQEPLPNQADQPRFKGSLVISAAPAAGTSSFAVFDAAMRSGLEPKDVGYAITWEVR